MLTTAPIAPAHHDSTERYAKCIAASKRVRWDIDRDVIRGRDFDLGDWFLPDGLARTGALSFLSPAQRRLLSQIQGRTYANMFGLVERFVGVKMLEVSRVHGLGDQVKLEALVRFTDEELKHQELFRRVERLCAEVMPQGYAFLPQPNDVASFVLSKCSWAVLALTCQIELMTQVHYRESIGEVVEVSALFKDVFLYHWKEESQHAVLDELEWQREDATLDAAAREAAVDDLIALVGGVDSLLQMQALSDAGYFLETCGANLADVRVAQIEEALLRAYRWQYIGSGAAHPRFNQLLGSMVTAAQGERIGRALAPLLG